MLCRRVCARYRNANLALIDELPWCILYRWNLIQIKAIKWSEKKEYEAASIQSKLGYRNVEWSLVGFFSLTPKLILPDPGTFVSDRRQPVNDLMTMSYCNHQIKSKGIDFWRTRKVFRGIPNLRFEREAGWSSTSHPFILERGSE